jgi:hypothetical protein
MNLSSCNKKMNLFLVDSFVKAVFEEFQIRQADESWIQPTGTSNKFS